MRFVPQSSLFLDSATAKTMLACILWG